MSMKMWFRLLNYYSFTISILSVVAVIVNSDIGQSFQQTKDVKETIKLEYVQDDYFYVYHKRNKRNIRQPCRNCTISTMKNVVNFKIVRNSTFATSNTANKSGTR